MTGKLHISKFKFETRNSNHACVCRPERCQVAVTLARLHVLQSNAV